MLVVSAIAVVASPNKTVVPIVNVPTAKTTVKRISNAVPVLSLATVTPIRY